VFRARDYEAALKQIRYREGAVEWRERNHYFSDWCEFNIANGVCRAVALPGGEPVQKMLTTMRGIEPRRMSLTAVPRASVIAHRDLVATGDIIGFLSRRPGLDYFHTGFIVVDAKGDLWLRHAARSQGRVLDVSLARFMNVNGVRAVTVVRPQEPWPANEVV
ncbi:MAG TPA: N-acetylmuramoyl-L-alanine amidase-like domain-containing protein, partial [Pseudolabrys sp.]|nr:N-acetylmuramoyl-L-alanine amidase-like domain-containing protein [Pseudolabrys sp.]